MIRPKAQADKYCEVCVMFLQYSLLLAYKDTLTRLEQQVPPLKKLFHELVWGEVVLRMPKNILKCMSWGVDREMFYC